MRSQVSHVNNIDRLRAFAALSIFFAHLLNPRLEGVIKYLFTGSPAVALFFVISGFCIHYPYRSKSGNLLQVKAFLAARYIRILLPVGIAYLLARSLHMDNYNFIQGWILWSIVCELWYYTFYPVFLRVARKYSWNALILTSFALSIALVLYFGRDEWGNNITFGPYFNWLVSLPSWLLGCKLAELDFKTKASSFKTIVCWRIFAAVTASTLAWLTLNTPIGYCYTIIFFSILIFFWVRAEISSKESKSIFDWLGSWSFSIYLIHMIAYTYLEKFYLPFQVKMILYLFLCYVFFRIVEYPSHILSRRVFAKLKHE